MIDPRPPLAIELLTANTMRLTRLVDKHVPKDARNAFDNHISGVIKNAFNVGITSCPDEPRTDGSSGEGDGDA